MKKIIVVGYPKSGNTWLTRLVAELANAPVKGFLYSNHFEIATEGLDRDGDYECYKSHHQFNEIDPEDIKTAKIIYIVRDPRDVSLSGRSFFYQGVTIINVKSSVFNFINRVVDKLYRMILGDAKMKQAMNNAVLNGDNNVHHWCRVSWKDHLTPYLKNDDILKIKYEAVLRNPIQECQRIVDYIGLERNEQDLLRAIESQSFSKVKEKFKKNNELMKANFLRKGKACQWKSKMAEQENTVFVNKLKRELLALGYELT